MPSRSHGLTSQHPARARVLVAGTRVDPKLEKAQKMADRRKQIEEEERNMEWGKGLVQKREREERALELAREAAKPFARSVDARAQSGRHRLDV